MIDWLHPEIFFVPAFLFPNCACCAEDEPDPGPDILYCNTCVNDDSIAGVNWEITVSGVADNPAVTTDHSYVAAGFNGTFDLERNVGITGTQCFYSTSDRTRYNGTTGIPQQEINCYPRWIMQQPQLSSSTYWKIRAFVASLVAFNNTCYVASIPAYFNSFVMAEYRADKVLFNCGSPSNVSFTLVEPFNPALIGWPQNITAVPQVIP